MATLNHRLKIRAVILALFSGLIMSAYSTPSAARVEHARAEYKQGVLQVWGQTDRAGQYVTLNERWIKRSNRLRAFNFRQKRVPRSCVARLKSEGQTKTVGIQGCRRR